MHDISSVLPAWDIAFLHVRPEELAGGSGYAVQGLSDPNNASGGVPAAAWARDCELAVVLDILSDRYSLHLTASAGLTLVLSCGHSSTATR